MFPHLEKLAKNETNLVQISQNIIGTSKRLQKQLANETERMKGLDDRISVLNEAMMELGNA